MPAWAPTDEKIDLDEGKNAEEKKEEKDEDAMDVESVKVVGAHPSVPE